MATILVSSLENTSLSSEGTRMDYEVKCIFCDKTWRSKDPEFLTVCGVCKKTVTTQFELQFARRPLVAPRLRLEEK